MIRIKESLSKSCECSTDIYNAGVEKNMKKRKLAATWCHLETALQTDKLSAFKTRKGHITWSTSRRVPHAICFVLPVLCVQLVVSNQVHFA